MSQSTAPVSEVPLPVIGRPMTCEQVDEQARAAALAWRAGRWSPTQARAALAALILPSGVAASVARASSPGRNHQMLVLDLADELVYLLILRVMGRPGSPPTFDLDLIADGASFCGGMRQYCRVAVLGKRRDLTARARKEFPLSTDLMGTHFLGQSASGQPAAAWPQAYPGRPAPGASLHIDEQEALLADERDQETAHERGQDALDFYAHAARNARTHGRLQVEGEALARMMRVRPMDRGVLTSVRARSRLVAWLGDEANTGSVREVAEALLDDAPTGRGRRSEIASMMRTWSREELEALVTRPEFVAHRLALAAASPRPAPAKEHVTEVGRQASALLGGVPRTAARLARAWAESVTELDGTEYSGRGARTGATVMPKAEASLVADRAEFEAQATRLIATGRTGLGSTPEQVAVTLAGLLNEIRGRAHDPTAGTDPR